MVIWKRKIYRIVMGSIFPTIYLITKSSVFPLILSSFFLTLLLALEYERYKNPNIWNWILSHFGGIFKTTPGTLTGDTNFMIASFLSILYFPREVAIANLYFLVFGDAGSAIIGKKFGKLTIFPNKTAEGMIGGILFNLIVAGILLNFLDIGSGILISGLLVGSIMEVLPFKVDDNLTVGIIPGIVMSLLYLLR